MYIIYIIIYIILHSTALALALLPYDGGDDLAMCLLHVIAQNFIAK